MLIDTHAHLYWESYKEDLNDVLKRSVDAGISIIVNIGVDVEKSKQALKQNEEDLSEVKGLSAYSTIGIHPHEAMKYTSEGSLQEDIRQLEEIYLANPAKVVGVGECGLDFYFPDNNNSHNYYKEYKENQRKLFQAQINLAKKLNLPLIVHCRDDRSKDPENSEAWDEILKMVGNYPTILHCYSGLSHTTNYLLHTTNIFVSFAANITYPKNGYLKEAAKILPLNKILLETDSPFLSPQSKRGQKNEPASVKETAQLIADLRGISFEEVAQQTTQNALTIFSLKNE